MIQTHSQPIESLVMEIRDGKLLLPEMQRGYVWKSTQVRDLFDSLYRGYPSGQLLVWETDNLPTGSHSASLEGLNATQRSPRLLLDGQQRLTSLAAVMLGRDLVVKDTSKPIDIAFNVFTEKFEVASKRHSIQNNWISLAKFFTQGTMVIFLELGLDPKTPEAKVVLERLSRLDKIKNYPYYVNVLIHLDYAEVTRIFVRTNSGGTSLGHADLALAQVSSYWHGMTAEFEQFRRTFHKQSWGLEIDDSLILRAIVVVLTGQSRFPRLFREEASFTVDQIKEAWTHVKKALAQAVDFLAKNCLIDHLDLLPTRSILMPLIAFFNRFGNHLTLTQARDLQRWVYLALIWTRYSASSETAMDQDIAAVAKENPVQALVQNLENEIGQRIVTAQDLEDQRKNSPYMLMAYVLTRQAKAQDWFTGIAIGNNQSSDEYHLHHIFPKAALAGKYDLRKDSRVVDQVANLAFLTTPVASKSIANRLPAKYLPEIEKQRLQAQHVPMESEYWELEHFEDFLRRRREMLANAINQLLSSLSETQQIWVTAPAQVLEKQSDALEHRLRDLISQRLQEARGDSAWDALVPDDIRKTVRSHIKKQETNNPFASGEHETLEARLKFCMFSELFRIIKENWSLFSDVFGTEQKLETNKQHVLTARNAFKHHNAPSDTDLAFASAGLLWFERCLEKVEVEEEKEEEVLAEA